MFPKGGKAIWGDASWSPEEGYDCSTKKVAGNAEGYVKEKTADGLELGAHGKPSAHYGRMVAFGKEAASLSVEVIANRHEVKVPLFPLPLHKVQFLTLFQNQLLCDYYRRV